MSSARSSAGRRRRTKVLVDDRDALLETCQVDDADGDLGEVDEDACKDAVDPADKAPAGSNNWRVLQPDDADALGELLDMLLVGLRATVLIDDDAVDGYEDGGSLDSARHHPRGG